jgi:hypothetical protein
VGEGLGWSYLKGASGMPSHLYMKSVTVVVVVVAVAAAAATTSAAAIS